MWSQLLRANNCLHSMHFQMKEKDLSALTYYWTMPVKVNMLQGTVMTRMVLTHTACTTCSYSQES